MKCYFRKGARGWERGKRECETYRSCDGIIDNVDVYHLSLGQKLFRKLVDLKNI